MLKLSSKHSIHKQQRSLGISATYLWMPRRPGAPTATQLTPRRELRTYSTKRSPYDPFRFSRAQSDRRTHPNTPTVSASLQIHQTTPRGCTVPKTTPIHAFYHGCAMHMSALNFAEENYICVVTENEILLWCFAKQIRMRWGNRMLWGKSRMIWMRWSRQRLSAHCTTTTYVNDLHYHVRSKSSL